MFNTSSCAESVLGLNVCFVCVLWVGVGFDGVVVAGVFVDMSSVLPVLPVLVLASVAATAPSPPPAIGAGKPHCLWVHVIGPHEQPDM